MNDFPVPFTRRPQMANANSNKRLLTELLNRLTGESPPLPNLPEEIITEILLRLPVKSLLKFRSVSKSWLSSISTPQFTRSHLKISTQINSGRHNKLVFGSGARPAAFYTFSLNPKSDDKNPNSSMDNPMSDYDTIQIVGSCNGLVCVALNLGNVVIWNPATRKTKQLPVSGDNVFHAQYGFGYDAVNDDYKIVQFGWQIHNPELYDENEMKIYSSRAHSWRDADWGGDRIFDCPGVFVDGAIYWKVWRGGGTWGIIEQNMGTEAKSVVELPGGVSGGGHRVVLGVSGGCLCASFDHGSYMDVWVMKERDCWSKLVCFPYSFCREHPSHVRPKLLFVSENGGILLNLGSDFIMYKACRYHEIHRVGDHVEIEAATYCETLLSPRFHRIDSM